MPLNRRSFIGLSSLVLCGTALRPVSAFSSPPCVLAGGLPLWVGDESVFAFLRSYSANFRIIGASVLGRIRASRVRDLHLIVEVGDLGEMQAALAIAPFAGIYAHDNTLTFTLANADVTIENLLPEAFAARLAAMARRSGNAFAHDALAYDPQTRELSDPFNGRVGALKIVNKTFGGPAALEVALRGIVEALDLGIPQGTDFALWKSRILQMIAKSADAQKLSATFLQQLAGLADQLPPLGVARILRTRLVVTALKQVFQLQIEGVITAFQNLRAAATADTTDAALWLAALLSPEIEGNAADGAATTWVQAGDRFQVMRSRRALVQAQTILQG